jgi:uncharacterized Tic20 family protein
MDTQDILGQDILPANLPTSDEKTMAVLSHILTFVAGFVAPLIIYLVKKDESPFVRAHAIESLNFQITLIIALVICFILMLVLIGVFLIALVGIAATVLVIVATIKASEGKIYKYPFTLRVVS